MTFISMDGPAYRLHVRDLSATPVQWVELSTGSIFYLWHENWGYDANIYIYGFYPQTYRKIAHIVGIV